jgi:hypothetical protein
MDRIYNKMTKRHGAFYPEARLPLVIIGAFSFPVTITLYGWTAELRLPVGAFLASVSLLGISLVLSIVPLMTFITDAFGRYSASALTAVLIIRCLCGAFLPLLLPPLSDKIGYGFAFLVLAATMLLVAPVPVGQSWYLLAPKYFYTKCDAGTCHEVWTPLATEECIHAGQVTLYATHMSQERIKEGLATFERGWMR